MEAFIQAAIFLGVLIFIAFALVILYCLLKNEYCCCQDNKKQGKDYSHLDASDDEEEEFIPPDFQSFKPESVAPSPETITEEELSDATTFHYDESSDDLLKPPPENRPLKKMKKSESLSALSLVSREQFIPDTKVKLSLLYSKADLFLMVTINEVSGVPTKADKEGYEFIRLSLTLLPDKKYRSKTRFEFVAENTTLFTDTFKFSNVARDTLFHSAFRIRLYGKQKLKRDVCLGETIVQLADVAQRAGGFLTWRKFEPVKH